MTYLTIYRLLILLIYLFLKQAFIRIKQRHLQEVTTLLNPQDLTNKLNPFQEMVYKFGIVYLVKFAIYPKTILKLKSTISFRRK